MEIRLCDELEWGFGWFADEADPLARCSHALSSEGKVWIVDPVARDGIDDPIRALGDPAGVVQLLDRHNRDCARFAARLDVPLYRVPFRGVPGAPFEVRTVVRTPVWREVALWWPAERTIVCADALGTTGYFLAPRERMGVHPLLRLFPPRRLAGLRPDRVLVGHGEGIDGPDAAYWLEEALSTSRRRIPRWLAGLVKKMR